MNDKKSELIDGDCDMLKAKPVGQMMDMLHSYGEYNDSMRHQASRLNDILISITGDSEELPELPKEPENMHAFMQAMNEWYANNITAVSDIITKLEHAL